MKSPQTESPEEDRSAQKALVSRDFYRAQERAQVLTEDPERLEGFVDGVMAKAKRIGGRRGKKKNGKLKQLVKNIMGLTRLIRAYARGEYTNIPRETIFSAVAALVYFWMPLDFLPDWLLGLGFLDDAAVAGYVISALRDDIERFMAWEKNKE